MSEDSFAPKEILELLGDISLNFVYLEQLISSTISNALSIDSFLIDMLMGGDDFKSLLGKYKKSVIYVLDNYVKNDNPLYKKAFELFDGLDKANNKRNRYLHGFITENPFGGHLVLDKFQRDINKKDHRFFKRDKISIDELKKDNEYIKNCAILISDFEQEIIKLVYPEYYEQREKAINEIRNKKETNEKT